MKKTSKLGNQPVIEEIQRLAAGLDAMSSLLAEVKAGSKPGKTFVLLLNIFLLGGSRQGSVKLSKNLSLQSLADAMNMDCGELTAVLAYLNNRGIIAFQITYQNDVKYVKQFTEATALPPYN
ncbi:MAG: hypothetical protein KGZ57_09215 [Dethiobacter sp.]|nr:hypothetical protein [Dethiobacter sp.]